MALSQGDAITRAYFNGLQTQISNVLGTGSVNFGYGQSVTSAQNPTDPIQAADWAALRNDINKCRLHQSGAEFTQNELPTPVSSGLISASDHNQFQTAVNTVQTNHLVANSAVLTYSPNIFSNTRTSSWATTIDCQVIFTWPSLDAKRYFFNTGGSLTFLLSHPSSGAAQDQSWNAVLAGIGLFTYNYSGLSRAGNLGAIANPLPPYTSGANTTGFSGTNIGAGAYAANDVYVNIQVSDTNIIFTFILTDDHTNVYYDLVSAGTTLTCNQYKSTAVMTSIQSPTVALYNSNGF